MSGDRRVARLDLLLCSILALMLVPAVVVNVVVWYDHFSGVALYDPAIGGDPAWRLRPTLAPLLVGVTAVARLGLARFWSIEPRHRRALLSVVLVAVLAAAASQLPEPKFAYSPS